MKEDRKKVGINYALIIIVDEHKDWLNTENTWMYKMVHIEKCNKPLIILDC